MPEVRCPTCNTMFAMEETEAMPFCSERCRLLDLGQWLNEEHGVPLQPEDKADENHARLFRQDQYDDGSDEN